MTPELGQLALVLAFLLAIAQGVLPLLGAWRGNRALMAVARPAAAGQAVFVAMAFGILAWAFLHFDFSVQYVADNSNLALPWYYRIAAVWGAHEGSLLLWILILNLWTVALAALSHRLPEVFAARVLGVMGLVAVGFLAFILFTSDPFGRLLPMPADGADLNPVLQDPGMTFHPPVLYMGYVGFSVAFAFSIAALLGGEVEQAWVRWARPWTNAAWGFLTLGIVAGSWWAYAELGWGGWWFWDPVENASFMPWLVGAALIHAQAITEKRGGLRAWARRLLGRGVRAAHAVRPVPAGHAARAGVQLEKAPPSPLPQDCRGREPAPVGPCPSPPLSALQSAAAACTPRQGPLHAAAAGALLRPPPRPGAR